MATERKRGKKALIMSSFRPTWWLTRVLNPRGFSCFFFCSMCLSTRKLIMFDLYPVHWTKLENTLDSGRQNMHISYQSP